MGCDIHLHSEVKINGTWYHYAEYNCIRDYDLFAKMANVKNYDNDIEPIALPRGLPEDVSFLTKFICDDYGIDGHSHSWLNAEEIALLQDWLIEQWGYFFGNPWGYFFGNTWGEFTKYPDGRPKGVEDIRFVFWFDD